VSIVDENKYQVSTLQVHGFTIFYSSKGLSLGINNSKSASAILRQSYLTKKKERNDGVTSANGIRSFSSPLWMAISHVDPVQGGERERREKLSCVKIIDSWQD